MIIFKLFSSKTGIAKKIEKVGYTSCGCTLSFLCEVTASLCNILLKLNCTVVLDNFANLTISLQFVQTGRTSPTNHLNSLKGVTFVNHMEKHVSHQNVIRIFDNVNDCCRRIWLEVSEILLIGDHWRFARSTGQRLNKIWAQIILFVTT